MLFSQPGANHAFSRVFGIAISSAIGSKACRRRRWGERGKLGMSQMSKCLFGQGALGEKSTTKNVKVLSMFPSRLNLCICNMSMFCAPIMCRQSVCDPRYQQCCRLHCWRGVWTFSCMWWKLPHVLPYSDSVPTHRDLVMLTSSIPTHPLVT